MLKQVNETEGGWGNTDVCTQRVRKARVALKNMARVLLFVYLFVINIRVDHALPLPQLLVTFFDDQYDLEETDGANARCRASCWIPGKEWTSTIKKCT